MPPVVVLRQPLALRVFFSLMLGIVALMSAVGGVAAGGRWVPLGLVAGAAHAALTVRNWRLAVLASEDGLTIRNLVRTHELSWSEVDRVPVDLDEVCVRLRSGREIAVSAFSLAPGALTVVRSRNRRAARELRQIVARHRRR